MSKTHKEMALEYAHQVQLFWDGGPLDHYIVVLKEMAFLAGYRSRDEEVEQLKEEIATLKADLREGFGDE